MKEIEITKEPVELYKILKFEGGKVVATEMIMKNFARVTYTPENYIDA